MIVNVPARAPSTRPDTGASSSSIPRLESSAPSARVATGSAELMSMTMLPAASALAAPLRPSNAERTVLPSGSMVTRTRAPLATSASQAHDVAPGSLTRDALSWTRSG